MSEGISTGRTHIVMVPGFAGFDALGQLEYYSGITPIFQRWRESGRGQCVLHYFGNLPTAGVATRARALRSYLAKRLARAEFQPGDRLCLVGHSTGGLDIRRLILDLRYDSAPDAVDGPQPIARQVSPGTLLEMVGRVVFLSVPQLGTNIADWVRAHRVERKIAVAQMRQSVGAAAHVPSVDQMEAWVAGRLAAFTGADLLLAVQDALSEMDTRARSDASGAAEAREAAAELALWLRHIDADFNAIDDLCSQAPEDSQSPAHRGLEGRKEELALWAECSIRSLSFATLGTRAFRFEPGEPAPAWKLWSPSSWTELEHGASGCDVAYRLSYRACAGGSFQASADIQAPTQFFDGSPAPAIERWDNDGIVNTASMFWPNGADTRLVRADHGDIIGHFELAPAEPNSGRKYHTYDLLNSDSRATFQRTTLERVWNEVFD
ncbi:MAG TPA: hypothetical protein VG963_18035, partial [Polyangiaceae bacterium]|nr:hypothetical protein [Polyangiaceae bacterium]